MAVTPLLCVPSRLRWPGFVAQAAEAMGAYGVVAKKLVASSRQAFHSLPLYMFQVIKLVGDVEIRI